MFKIFIFFINLNIVIRIGYVSSSESEKRLFKDLFKDYDPNVRPAEFNDKSLNVTFSMALFQLVNINEKQQTFEVSVWLRQVWYDYQLVWDPAKYNNITQINSQHEKVWIPDIVHYNNVMEDNMFGGNLNKLQTYVMISNNGTMHWYAPAILKSDCHINVEKFPFDIQHCEMMFGSWTFDTSRLNLTALDKSVDLDKYMTSSEWDVVDTKVDQSVTTHTCCQGDFPLITFKFYFARRSLFYVLNLIFPIAVITLLTTVAFLLPAESGERISLAITLMLAVTVFMLIVAEKTPETSDHVPLISVYFSLCMLSMFVMIVMLCYINRMYNSEVTDRLMSPWLRRVFLEYLSYLLFIQYRPNRVDTCAGNEEIDSSASHSRNNERKTNVVMLASTFDERNGIDVTLQSYDSAKIDSFSTDTVRKHDCDCNRRQGSARNDNIRPVALHETNDEDTFKKEWRIVAMTIDRCLFIFFIIFFFLITISIFAKVKYVT